MSKRSRIVRRRMRAIDRRERDDARWRCVLLLENITVNHDHVLTWDMVKVARSSRDHARGDTVLEIRIPQLGKPTIAIQSVLHSETLAPMEDLKPFILADLKYSLERFLRYERWGHMLPKPGASVRECREAETKLLEQHFDQRILYGVPS